MDKYHYSLSSSMAFKLLSATFLQDGNQSFTLNFTQPESKLQDSQYTLLIGENGVGKRIDKPYSLQPEDEQAISNVQNKGLTVHSWSDKELDSLKENMRNYLRKNRMDFVHSVE